MNILISSFLLIPVYLFMVFVRNKVAAGQVSTEPLTLNEKIIVWIICFLTPIGGIMIYLGWVEKLPLKAKATFKITFVAPILILLSIVSYFLLLSHL